MPKIVKIALPNGQTVDGVELAFTIVREEWNEYALADGGRVRVRTGVHKIFQIVDAKGTPARNQDGDPEVVVRSNLEVVSSS
jgi:hypothetical protein